MSDSITATAGSLPTIGGHHLGGVRTVMMFARHTKTDEIVSLPLRLVERNPNDQWVFELADPEWLGLLDFDFERVCLAAQVEQRFVTIDADIVAVDEHQRLLVQARTQTFWDVPSGRVFRVAAGVTRPRIPFRRFEALED